MRYYIIAGEASGDLYGANLIEALRNGYVSVVPIHPDFTHYPAIEELASQYK